MMEYKQMLARLLPMYIYTIGETISQEFLLVMNTLTMGELHLHQMPLFIVKLDPVLGRAEHW